jgi:hypothetical protein
MLIEGYDASGHSAKPDPNIGRNVSVPAGLFARERVFWDYIIQ